MDNVVVTGLEPVRTRHALPQRRGTHAAESENTLFIMRSVDGDRAVCALVKKRTKIS